MYSELYEVWKQELEVPELQKLQPDFYLKIADYLRRLREESRMLDRKTVKAALIAKEMHNVKRMLRDIIRSRYRKIIGELGRSGQITKEALTQEEVHVLRDVSPFAEAYRALAARVLRGQLPDIEARHVQKRAILRFLKDVPAVVGADMKTYGPFKPEDIASMPFENVKVLVKQGLAERVQAS